jgi:hypothetical protein
VEIFTVRYATHYAGRKGEKKAENSKPMKNVRYSYQVSPNKEDAIVNKSGVFESVYDCSLDESQRTQDTCLLGESLSINTNCEIENNSETLETRDSINEDSISVDNEPSEPMQPSVHADVHLQVNPHARPSWVEQIFEKLVIIDKKPSKADEINNKLSEAVHKVKSVESDLNSLKKHQVLWVTQ